MHNFRNSSTSETEITITIRFIQRRTNTNQSFRSSLWPPLSHFPHVIAPSLPLPSPQHAEDQTAPVSPTTSNPRNPVIAPRLPGRSVELITSRSVPVVQFSSTDILVDRCEFLRQLVSEGGYAVLRHRRTGIVGSWLGTSMLWLYVSFGSNNSTHRYIDTKATFQEAALLWFWRAVGKISRSKVDGYVQNS